MDWNGMGWASDLVASDWMEGGHGWDGIGDAWHKMDTETYVRMGGWMDRKEIMFETNERLFFLVVFDLVGREICTFGA
jgi:hypothetical protein